MPFSTKNGHNKVSGVFFIVGTVSLGDFSVESPQSRER